MANKVVIIERVGPRLDGIVLHDIEVDGEIKETGKSYSAARALALVQYIDPLTVVIERNESTGKETSPAYGQLVDGNGDVNGEW